MRHLYLHVPFCARRCVYCDFAIAVRARVPADQFVAAVGREHATRRARDQWDRTPLETLYLGGGTPSLLPAPQVAGLVGDLLTAERPGGKDLEVTIEANPDDVTPDAATTWVRAGVNRVSLGVQSFDAGVLAWMHRTHGPGAAESAVARLRDAGARSISLDLIFALPAHLGRDWPNDLERALALNPEHLSVYGLTVEPRTPLARWVGAGSVRPADEDRYADEFLLADRVLRAEGYDHYEVSNYARPNHRARHNRAYWTGRAYAGLGPSAHSFNGDARSWNTAQWAAYERAVAERGEAEEGTERLTERDRSLERAYLGLRTAEGVRRDELAAGVEPLLQQGAARGWLEWDGERVRLTPEGWLRLDELAAGLTGGYPSGLTTSADSG